MATYRKKPVEVEAYQILLGMTVEDFPVWLYNAYNSETSRKVFFDFEAQKWAIQTLEGIMYANYGDYIIKGIAGELYPCKPDIFEATYELVTP